MQVSHVARRRGALAVLAVLGTLANSRGADAHVTYLDLDQPPELVTMTFGGAPIADPCAGWSRGCQSSNGFTRYGWVRGTEPRLADSHQLTVAAEFWKFHLDQTTDVVIELVQGQAGIDPAISLYRGLLPDMGHDDTTVDPLNPGDLGGCAAASPTDSHAAPYTYLAHDGFRDTQGGTTSGGLADCRLAHPYAGQFDAFASWSIANLNGAWSEISFVAAVSATSFTGNDGGIHIDGNHLVAAGTGETLAITLPAGDYTIAAGGEACSAAVTTCTSPRLYGTVRINTGVSGPDAGAGAPDAPTGLDAGIDPRPAGPGGCSSGPGAPGALWLAAAAWLARRRTRRRPRAWHESAPATHLTSRRGQPSCSRRLAS